uniref:Replication-associated protein n=1 Tax=Ficedula parva Genomoviridae sp. TaxID=2814952 RepID=A0A8E7G297_9VIRU
MSFTVNSKYVLLTYAQCGDLDGFTVMDRISSLGGECIVARESHEDGGVHLHVFCDFGRKFRSRKADVFDVDGVHPNIVASRGTPEKGYDYTIKDGDVICGGLARPEGKSGGGDGSVVSRWTEITGAGSREEFWELVHRLDPKSAACSFTSLSKYADWKFAVNPPCYESPGGITFVGGDMDRRDDWLSQSGIGSGEPLIDECLKYGDVEYAVFDDIRGGIKFFPSYKEWLGCQAWVTVKCLYREPKLIPWGKPSIWLSNTDPRAEMLQSEVDWMEKNCIFVEVNDPIFRANTE